MANSHSTRVLASLLVLVSCLLQEIVAVEYASQEVNDLETILPPWVDSFGAPTAQVNVYYNTNSTVGKVKLGKRYDRNQVQAAPHVYFKGDAIHKGDYYTLLLVDPDGISPTTPIIRNFLHWLVTNIPGGIKSNQEITDVGDEVLPYISPMPPVGTHRYIFLLFSQGKNKIDAPVYPRFLFSLRNFTNTFHLGYPLGGTLFRASFNDQ